MLLGGWQSDSILPQAARGHVAAVFFWVSRKVCDRISWRKAIVSTTLTQLDWSIHYYDANAHLQRYPPNIVQQNIPQGEPISYEKGDDEILARSWNFHKCGRQDQMGLIFMRSWLFRGSAWTCNRGWRKWDNSLSGRTRKWRDRFGGMYSMSREKKAEKHGYCSSCHPTIIYRTVIKELIQYMDSTEKQASSPCFSFSERWRSVKGSGTEV